MVPPTCPSVSISPHADWRIMVIQPSQTDICAVLQKANSTWLLELTGKCWEEMITTDFITKSKKKKKVKRKKIIYILAIQGLPPSDSKKLQHSFVFAKNWCRAHANHAKAAQLSLLAFQPGLKRRVGYIFIFQMAKNREILKNKIKQKKIRLK